MFPRFVTHSQPLSALPRHIRRLVQRKLGRSLVGAAVLFTLGHGHALAATIHVTGACTLVDAITAANTDAVAGGCNGGSGADTIVLEAGSTHTLTVENNTTYEYGSTGLPVVTSEITIEGNGSTIKRDSSAPVFRLMAVNASGHLTVQQITVSGGVASGELFIGAGGGIFNLYGSLTLIDSTISGNSAIQKGGGIRNEKGLLTLIDSAILGNSAGFDGGGLYTAGSAIVTNSTVSGNVAGSGGGVANSRSALTLINSRIANNTAASSGGGIYNYGGFPTLTLIHSIVSGNMSGRSGGGISDSGGAVVLNNSTVLGNVAAFRGGGLDTHSGSLALTDTLVSDNFAARHGGGVSTDEGRGNVINNSTVSGNSASGCGGGLYSDDGGLRLIDSTVSGNSAGWGGGICNEESVFQLMNSTVSGNSASRDGGGLSNGSYGSLTLTNSTVSGNVAGDEGGGIVTGGDYSNLELTQSTISGNTAATQGGGIDSAYDGTVKLVRSLIAGNTAPTGPEVSNTHDAKIRVNQFNLFGLNGDAGVAGFSPKPKDIVPAAGVMLGDILAPLADNSGPTLTHALVIGSPAVDEAGPRCPPPETDQRGVPRPQQTACDIGAFELVSQPPATCDSCLDTDSNGKIDLLDGRCVVKTLTSLRGALSLDSDPQQDAVSLHATFSSVGVSLDPPTEGVTLSFMQDGAVLACVHLPAGEGWQADKKRERWVFREQHGNNGQEKEVASIQCRPAQRTCVAQVAVEDVQLGSAVAGEIMTTVVIGDEKLIKTQVWEARAQGKRLITK